MPKTKISEFSSTPANNTDIDSINIAENCPPSGINDAIRELMAQLKDFQTGAVGDSFNGPVGTTTAAAGAFTTLSASGAVTLSGGTANGVTYLNGSKVVTSGSALVFDGTRFGVGSAANSGYNAAFVSQVGSDTGTSGVMIRGADGYLSFDSGVAGFGTTGIYGNAGGGTSANSYLTFRQNATEQMRLTSTGLGIGTSSPVSKIDARAASAAMGNYQTIQAFSTDATAINLGGGISLGGNYSGSSTFAQFASIAGRKENATDGNYAGYLQFGTNSQATGVREVMRLDASGNLGLGVTPSAWGNSIRAIEGYSSSGSWSIASGGGLGSALNIQSNTYYNGSDWIYKDTNLAANYYQNAGTHNWRIAASGTAGNAVTWTQAMTLDASGNLGVGTTSASLNNSNSCILNVSPNAYSVTNHANGVSSATRYAYFGYNGSEIGSITQNGTTAVAYNTSSDYRLKNTIAPMTGALAKVALLKPVTYKWNADGSDGQGFIAHELAEVVPDCVTGEKDAVDAEGNPQYQGIDVSFLVATLTAALQEAVAKINSLEARLDAANL